MSDLKEQRILYVEDDSATREALGKFIKNRVGKLYVAATGEEGIEKSMECKPNIIIADLIMPGISGLEMIEEIRKENKTCRVLITSTINEVSTVLEAVDLGIDHYIIKPIDTEELVEKLEKMAKSIECENKEKQKSNFFGTFKNVGIIEETLRKELLGIMKTKLGRGPQDIKIMFFENTIEIFAMDAFTIMEKTIAENKRNLSIVEQFRKVFYETISPELENIAAEITGCQIKVSSITVDAFKRIDKICLSIS